MGVSKVVYGTQTIIDLTSDTVTADKLLEGITAHGKDGEPVTGTCTFDADTSDATATASEILATKTAYVNGSKITGSMVNRGKSDGTISDKATPYSIPAGYHDGSGEVSIDATEQGKIVPQNIREGITILGVEGEMSGSEDLKPQQKSVAPSTEKQVITPDEGYNALSQVTVLAIPYNESDNPAGGKTVTIGAAA